MTVHFYSVTKSETRYVLCGGRGCAATPNYQRGVSVDELFGGGTDNDLVDHACYVT